jgi:hypothetical protein
MKNTIHSPYVWQAAKAAIDGIFTAHQITRQQGVQFSIIFLFHNPTNHHLSAISLYFKVKTHISSYDHIYILYNYHEDKLWDLQG